MKQNLIQQKNGGLRIGYARVSTHEQSLDLQLDSLNDASCSRIFDDTVSGIKDSRPGLNRAKDVLRSGDSLIVWRLDRLGRSLSDLIQWTEWLEKQGITLISLQEQIDTSTCTGKLVFHLFAALAEFERNLLRERTQAGLKAARARGRIGGRPKKLNKTEVSKLKAMHQNKTIPIKEICTTLNISRTTLYRNLRYE